MTMSMRYTTRLTESPPLGKTKHYKGLPPELVGGKDERLQMEFPSLLVIEQKPDGVFLFRFTADRRCAGDTWHKTIDEAKQQASFEFEDLISSWKPVPAEVTDVISFGFNAED